MNCLQYKYILPPLKNLAVLPCETKKFKMLLLLYIPLIDEKAVNSTIF